LVLVVLLAGLGAYRLVSGPSTPAAPQPAAAAEEQDSAALAGDLETSTFDETPAGPSVRLGRHLVTLRGPGVAEPHRETSATALRRIREGWVVRLTSRACEGRADTRTSYGVARASGRFTSWDESAVARRPTWLSPDRDLVLVERGTRVQVRRIPTGKPVVPLGDFG